MPSPLMSESKARKVLLSQCSSSRAVLPCLLLSALITEQLVFHPKSLAGLKLLEAKTDFHLKKMQRAQSRQKGRESSCRCCSPQGHLPPMRPYAVYYANHLSPQFSFPTHFSLDISILCWPWQKLWKSWKLSYGVFLIFPDNWVSDVLKKKRLRKERTSSLSERGLWSFRH